MQKLKKDFSSNSPSLCLRSRRIVKSTESATTKTSVSSETSKNTSQISSSGPQSSLSTATANNITFNSEAIEALLLTTIYSRTQQHLKLSRITIEKNIRKMKFLTLAIFNAT